MRQSDRHGQLDAPEAGAGVALTVVVAVHNVREYLDACLRSLLAQTALGEMEIVLVDDGSTDGSGERAEWWSDRSDGRLRVIHQPNGGLGAARNAGLGVARGSFVAFVDGDDLVDPRAYERLLGAAQEAGADLVAFDLAAFPHGEARFTRIRGAAAAMPGVDAVSGVLLAREVPSACNKLFRRELFERPAELRFPATWYEDLPTVPVAVARAQRAAYLPACLYYYRQRPHSITHAGGEWPERAFEVFDALELLLRRAVECSTERRALLDDYPYVHAFKLRVARLYAIGDAGRRAEVLARWNTRLNAVHPGWAACALARRDAAADGAWGALVDAFAAGKPPFERPRQESVSPVSMAAPATESGRRPVLPGEGPCEVAFLLPGGAQDWRRARGMLVDWVATRPDGCRCLPWPPEADGAPGRRGVCGAWWQLGWLYAAAAWRRVRGGLRAQDALRAVWRAWLDAWHAWAIVQRRATVHPMAVLVVDGAAPDEVTDWPGTDVPIIMVARDGDTSSPAWRAAAEVLPGLACPLLVLAGEPDGWARARAFLQAPRSEAASAGR